MTSAPDNGKKYTRSIVMVVIAVGLINLSAMFFKDVISLFGYYPDIGPLELAQKLVSEGMAPNECFRLLSLDIGPGLTTAEQRRGCVYNVAQLEGDPEICKLLMPSAMANSCLTKILLRNWRESTCYARDNGLECRILSQSSFLPDKLVTETMTRWSSVRPNLEDCSSVKEVLARDWCYSQRSRENVGVDDCNKVSGGSQRQDDCFYAVARRDKSIGRCEAIRDPVIRSACRVHQSP